MNTVCYVNVHSFKEGGLSSKSLDGASSNNTNTFQCAGSCLPQWTDAHA